MYKWNKPLLQIGQGQVGGIEFKRIYRSYGLGEGPGRIGQFNHNWDIRLRRKPRPNSGADVIVTSDELSYTFFDAGPQGALSLSSNTSYATMNKSIAGSVTTYTMTTADGTVLAMRSSGSGNPALPQTLTRANGARYSMTHDGNDRLRRVASNAGYALLLEYTTTSSTLVSKACVLNLASAPAPSTNICPSGASSISYSYTNGLATSETDATGAVWPFTSSYTNSFTPFSETYKLPGAALPYLTLNYEYAENYKLVISSQVFGDGRVYNYGWTAIMEGGTSENVLALVPVQYNEDQGTMQTTINVYRFNVNTPPRIAPGISYISDVRGATTSFDWCLQTCAYALLRSKTMPGGMKATYTYDLYRNITQTVYTPKPGSPLDPITTSANFNCSTMVNCNKPTYTIDGKGNQTDFSYDPVHGGLLSETKPAVGGIRPQTRTTYTQRSAWVSNGSGGYVQATPPIWLPSTESFCRTSAAGGSACTVTGDEVTTTYEYGPNSGPNTLLLRGKAVTADGVTLRTCYGYDGFGRKISETSPNANLASCS